MNTKRQGLSKEEFFNEISQIANFCDARIVESIYYAMVKVICRQLRNGKRIKLPDWGEFYIHKSCPRMASKIGTGEIINIGMKNYVKFDPDYKVKGYFKALG
jgi:nucleoid DNA-binding protein